MDNPRLSGRGPFLCPLLYRLFETPADEEEGHRLDRLSLCLRFRLCLRIPFPRPFALWPNRYGRRQTVDPRFVDDRLSPRFDPRFRLGDEIRPQYPVIKRVFDLHVHDLLLSDHPPYRRWALVWLDSPMRAYNGFILPL